jgi:DNA-directed RNA polymerase subunit RPC12/RpoP
MKNENSFWFKCAKCKSKVKVTWVDLDDPARMKLCAHGPARCIICNSVVFVKFNPNEKVLQN